eukprot:37751-Prorocentrum_minimum.AAC.3
MVSVSKDGFREQRSFPTTFFDRVTKSTLGGQRLLEGSGYFIINRTATVRLGTFLQDGLRYAVESYKPTCNYLVFNTTVTLFG